jgi:hypothetical protein
MRWGLALKRNESSVEVPQQRNSTGTQLTKEEAVGRIAPKDETKMQQCGAAKDGQELGTAGRAVGLQRVLERSLGRLGRGVLHTVALVQCDAGCGRLQQRECLAGGALVCFEPKDTLGCRRSFEVGAPILVIACLHSGQATKPRAQARQQRWD